MDNSQFRNLLAQRDAEPAEKAQSGNNAEDRARKKAKQQAAYERRMAIQKRQEEALAAANKYTDRAAERRREMEKQGEAWVPEDTFQEQEEPGEVSVSSAPTFAQLGEQEDLSQQQHRLSIAQSKYLGGDIEHTHLVKGLDFALARKMRSELERAEAEKEKQAKEAEAKRDARGQHWSEASFSSLATKGSGKAKAAPSIGATGSATLRAAGGGASKPDGKVAFVSDMGREVYRAVFREAGRPNRALTEGRMLFVFDVDSAEGSCVPSTLIRSEDDLSVPVRSNTKRYQRAGLPDSLLSRLSKVMTYGAGGGERAKKKKEKERHHTDSLLNVPLLTMRPLKGESSGGSSKVTLSAAKPTAEGDLKVSSQAAATSVGVKKPSRWGLAAAATGGPAVASSNSAGVEAKALTAAPALEEDVDDIFGDGVGSDYVCKPSAEQLKRAARDERDTSLLKNNASGKVQIGLADDDEPEGAADVAVASGPVGGMGMLREEGNAEVDALLSQAMQSGRTSASASDARGKQDRARKPSSSSASVEVTEEADEVDDAELLRTSAAKKTGSGPTPVHSRDLKMTTAMMDDSYGECFPDTFEGYNRALHGPESDEEDNIVRGKKVEEDNTADQSGGKGGRKGKRGGVDVEALKQEAKMDRELAQIEKLMEERRLKRQRRDEGAAAGAEHGN